MLFRQQQSNLFLISLGRAVIVSCFFCFAGSASQAVSEASSRTHRFPEPDLVKNQVQFWELVFTKIPARQILIHDSLYPDVMIDLLDFDSLSTRFGSAITKDRRSREQLTNRYLQRYELGLERFRRYQRAATKMGAIEQRLYSVYQRNEVALASLYSGKVKLRTQAGLADEFLRAIKRAAPYLPKMEEIFAEEGLPTSLTRLAFVESMFNLEAVSKVGASGIWQFMPGTARQFMRVNPFIDERRSPIKATRAAAQLLSDNYRILKSWPLAITAYNHGPASIQRAVRTLGTDSFATILEKYRHPSFGFASRNFYAEFLAARNVHRYMMGTKSKELTTDVGDQFVAIKLNQPLSIDELLKRTSLSRETLEQYNACLLPQAFERYRHHNLPKGFEIIVPQKIARNVTLALNANTRRVAISRL